MPNINCRIDRQQHKKLFEVIGEWAESDIAKQNFRDSYDAALKLIEPVFNVDANIITEIPITDGQIGVFKNRLKKLNDSINNGTLGSKFSQLFWTTSHQGKRDPIIANDFTQKQRIQQAYQENTNKIDVFLRSITTGLKDTALLKGMSKKGIKNTERELKDLNELYAKGKVAYLNNDTKLARELHIEYSTKEKELMDGEYGSVLNKMVSIIEKDIPKIIKEKDYKINQDGTVDTSKLLKDLKELHPDENELLNTVMTYTDLTNELYTMLDNATNKHVDVIIKKLESTGKIESARDLKEIKKSLLDKMKPQREIGYYPHFTRDFNISLMDGYMSKLATLQDSMNPYNLTKKEKSIDDAISDVRAYLSEFTRKRAKDPETGEFIFDYSKNLPEVLANYAHDVARFNFNSFMNANYIDSLNAIEKIFKTDGNAKNYATNIAQYIQDMHTAYNGKGESSISTNNLVRSMLSFEFVSKLGFNPRSALRNATQRVLDLVVWGPVQLKKLSKYRKSEGILNFDLDKFLTQKGILFQEASPDVAGTLGSLGRANEMSMVEWDTDKNKFVFVKRKKGEKVANVMSGIAAKSSVMHRKIENINRKATFQTAFAQMHKYLNTADYKSKLSKEGLSDKQIQQRIQRNSENFATRMTILNHFDYSQYAKSPFMRTKLGALVGQFQHYSFEFLERNISIINEAKYDIKSGSVAKKLLSGNGQAEGLSQAARMALIYFVAPTVGAVLSGVDFKNLLQHDTANRIATLAKILTTDEENIDEVIAERTYGKGALAYLGPSADTAIDVIDVTIEMGQALEFIDSDVPTLNSVINKYAEYDFNKDMETHIKAISIFNVFGGRLVDRHIPQIVQGRLGWAVQSESGLYATEYSKGLQKKVGGMLGIDTRTKAQKAKDKKTKDILASIDLI
tara:strand:+ start:5847 stop:8576 length:2730 start_codon:yes stop_codon:yes gene_type:complete